MADFSDTDRAPSRQNTAAWSEMTPEEEHEALVGANRTTTALFKIALAMAGGAEVHALEGQRVGESDEPTGYYFARYRVADYMLDVKLFPCGVNGQDRIVPATLTNWMAYADFEILVSETDNLGRPAASVGGLTAHVAEHLDTVGAGVQDMYNWATNVVDTDLTAADIITLLGQIHANAVANRAVINTDSLLSTDPSARPEGMAELLSQLSEAYANARADRTKLVR